MCIYVYRDVVNVEELSINAALLEWAKEEAATVAAKNSTNSHIFNGLVNASS
jgi:hypothetical protein